MPHCATCSCSWLWDIVSHHLLQVLQVTVGMFLGISLALWVWR